MLGTAENKVPRYTMVFHQIPQYVSWFMATAIFNLMMSFSSDSNSLNHFNDMPELISCWFLEPSFFRILISKGP